MVDLNKDGQMTRRKFNASRVHTVVNKSKKDADMTRRKFNASRVSDGAHKKDGHKAQKSKKDRHLIAETQSRRKFNASEVYKGKLDKSHVSAGDGKSHKDGQLARGPFNASAARHFNASLVSVGQHKLHKDGRVNPRKVKKTNASMVQKMNGRFIGQRAGKYAERLVEHLRNHRAKHCPTFAKEVSYEVHESTKDENGVKHFVLREKDGSLQYMAEHHGKILASYPPVCSRSTTALTQDGQSKMGSTRNLQTTDQQVEDCKTLIQQAAKEKCGSTPFGVTVINAKETVKDSEDIRMTIKVTPSDRSGDKYHIAECLLEFPSNASHAELLQKSRKLSRESAATRKDIDVL
jgi:hypothetical protein